MITEAVVVWVITAAEWLVGLLPEGSVMGFGGSPEHDGVLGWGWFCAELENCNNMQTPFISQVFGMINYVAPLQELLQALVVVIPLWLGFRLIVLIRQFLPM